MVKNINLLLDGVEAKPFFSTDEEYKAFRQSFIDEVGPKLREYELARKRSEMESMFRVVD